MIKRLDFRLADYDEALTIQRGCFDELKKRKIAGIPIDNEIIFFVEHKPVFTLGKHAHKENIINRQAIEKESIAIFETQRGGDITFHGPGQLTVYPIIDLEKHRLGVKKYVELLEQAVIDVLADYGLRGERVEGATGVWIDAGLPSERKICAIGIKCSRFITMHGLALNISTDLRYFSFINPCGFVDKGVTSMQRELGYSPDFDEISERLFRRLLFLFG